MESPLPPPRWYAPFKAGPFRMAMGLNELSLKEWIELDSSYVSELAQKRRLLSEHFDEVFRALPGTETSGKEVLELLASHLVTHFPEYFRRDGQDLRIALTGEKRNIETPATHPLDLAARLIQEDLCLMQPRDGVFCLTAASVCFPSRWKLGEKMGLPLREIHAPVPFFDKIATASDRFLTLLSPEKPVWRLNWTLHDSPELFQPTAPLRNPDEEAISSSNAGERVWLRVERQTLRRLARNGDVLFTIRTYVRPLAEFARPEFAGELASALRNLPQETFAYKSLEKYAVPTLEWLDSCIRQGP